MKSFSKKRFSKGWFTGVILGIASSAALVYAAVTVPITVFTSGTTISSDDMNANFNAFGTSSFSCAGNGPTDIMVRVGATCVDQFMARADFATLGCSADGMTNCDTVMAVSTNTGTAAVNMSWAQAQRACENANKRLLTPGEWLAAFTTGVLSETATDQMEFVDAFFVLSTLTGDTTPADAGYMGPRSASGGAVQIVANVDYTLLNPDGALNFIHFRCGR